MKQKLVIKQTNAMNLFSLKNKAAIFISACFLFLFSFAATAQTVVTHETFPNQFNTNFPYSNNSNGTFVGSSGTWTASCNSNALSAIAVLPAYYSPVTKAIKIVNWNTSGKGAADCHAASPTVNLSGYTCSPNLNLSFKLYTYTCSSDDPNSFFKVEFSTNSGSSWTSVLSLSSAQLYNTYGANGLTTLTVAIPAAYRVSSFKYRFSGYKPANQCNNFYLFVDEAKITATTCGGSIGDRVWFDTDGDGIQDASETTTLSGVTVQLKNTSGTVLATTTTNGSGNYLFTGLAAGTYKVDFPVSISSGILTTQNVGSNDNIDSDASPANGETGNITLATNQHITNVDAGYFPTLSLGSRVWYDANNNGIDGSENGIRNVTVNLYRDNNNDNVADGAAIATDITDVDGYYKFTNLVPGNYIVGAVLPAGYMSSSVNGGDPDNNINLDDNGQVMSGNEIRGLAITLSVNAEPSGGGEENLTYDFGLLPDCACTTSASNLLTNASFENGTTGWSWSGGSLTTGTGYIACGTKNGFNNQSSGTSKVWQDVTVGAGSTVTFKAFAGTHAPGINCSPKLSLIFLNSANTVIGQSDVTVTRIVGDYHDQLAQYSITAVAPANTVKARVQSSITCNTMKLDAFCLTAVTPPQGSIGDRVWEDLNRNGLQDSGEPGIAGATVSLTGAATATTTTAVDGSYNFSNLPSGTYTVTFTTPAGITLPTTSNVGTNDEIDSDPIAGVVANITLAAGQVNNTIDAGFYKVLSLSGNVWHDVNGMNDNLVNNTGPLQTPPASPIPTGLRISRVDAVTGIVLSVAIVQGNGAYTFGNVAPGNYILVLSQYPGVVGGFAPFTTLPSGWINTGEQLGLAPGRDAVINGKLTVSVTTVSVTNANFGIQRSSGDIGVD